MGSEVFIVFIILAFVAVVSALGMLLSRNAVYSALYLVLNFVTIGILYIILNAPFIAMVQITVYAGAIMVLFLFVIMLLGAEQLDALRSGFNFQSGIALGLGTLLILSLFIATFGSNNTAAAELATAPATLDASPAAVGLRLFEVYSLPFEVTSVLLLVSMIGVIVLRIRKRGSNA